MSGLPELPVWEPIFPQPELGSGGALPPGISELALADALGISIAMLDDGMADIVGISELIIEGELEADIIIDGIADAEA